MYLVVPQSQSLSLQIADLYLGNSPCRPRFNVNHVRVKSPGVPPGLANARPPGRAKLAKAPPPGTDKAGKCPAVARGGWAQVELTDA